MFKSFEWSYHTDRHQYYNDFSTRNDLYAEKYDPLTPEQTDALLRRYDADRLLVGHTIFPDISTFHDGRVIAVNVQNELNRRKNRGRAVLIEGSRISVVGNRGVKRVLEE